MLPKKNRAGTKTIEEIFSKGISLNSPNFSFRFVKTPKKTVPQISFIAPKSVAKTAVGRNFLKRRGYSVLEKKIHQFPLGLRGAFIFKKSEVPISTIDNEIKIILSKL